MKLGAKYSGQELRRRLRLIRRGARTIRRALVSKGTFLADGSSAVSTTCQIPELRQKYAALGLPKKGLFVEIGAYDGETWSNTSFLADEGWHGIYVEPVPAFCAQIKLRHFLNNICIENVAISDAEGAAQIDLVGPLTTLSKPTRAAYKDITWARSISDGATALEVRTTTLQKLLSKNSVPCDFDLMIIDVEGHEEAVISGLMATLWRPAVLIVELVDLHPDFAELPDLQASARRVRQAILADGYEQFYSDPINSIFERADQTRQPPFRTAVPPD